MEGQSDTLCCAVLIPLILFPLFVFVHYVSEMLFFNVDLAAEGFYYGDHIRMSWFFFYHCSLSKNPEADHRGPRYLDTNSALSSCHPAVTTSNY